MIKFDKSILWFPCGNCHTINIKLLVKTPRKLNKEIWAIFEDINGEVEGIGGGC